jgi:hypothetical protein
VGRHIVPRKYAALVAVLPAERQQAAEARPGRAVGGID